MIARIARLRAPEGPALGVPDTTGTDLARCVAAYDQRADTSLIERAFQVASAAHAGQTRENGDPYITHPVAVAEILAGFRLDTASIACLLYTSPSPRDRG